MSKITIVPSTYAEPLVPMPELTYRERTLPEARKSPLRLNLRHVACPDPSQE